MGPDWRKSAGATPKFGTKWATHQEQEMAKQPNSVLIGSATADRVLYGSVIFNTA